MPVEDTLSGLREWLTGLVKFINEYQSIPEVLREQRLTPIVQELQRSSPEIREWIQKDTKTLLWCMSVFMPDLRAKLRDPIEADRLIRMVRERLRP